MPSQIPPIDSVSFDPDSAKVALTNLAQEIATNPNQFIEDVIRDLIGFGLKVLAAIVIYSIGAWVIRKVKQLLHQDLRAETYGEDAVIFRYQSGFDNIDSNPGHSHYRNPRNQHNFHRGVARGRRYGDRYGSQRNRAEFRRWHNDIAVQAVQSR